MHLWNPCVTWMNNLNCGKKTPWYAIISCGLNAAYSLSAFHPQINALHVIRWQLRLKVPISLGEKLLMVFGQGPCRFSRPTCICVCMRLCMCASVSACMYVCVLLVCINICVLIYVHVCLHVCSCEHICMLIHVHVYWVLACVGVNVFTCMCVFVCVCTCVRAYAYACVCAALKTYHWTEPCLCLSLSQCYYLRGVPQGVHTGLWYPG